MARGTLATAPHHTPGGRSTDAGLGGEARSSLRIHYRQALVKKQPVRSEAPLIKSRERKRRRCNSTINQRPYPFYVIMVSIATVRNMSGNGRSTRNQS